MATPTWSINNAIITRQSEGWSGVIKPLGMEFEIGEGNPVFKYLMKKLKFRDYIKSVLNRKPHPEDPVGKLNLLKEDIKNGVVKLRVEFYVETKIE